MIDRCQICGSERRRVLYKGPVRLGKFGQFHGRPQTVLGCDECETGYLEALEIDYESSEYRELVEGSGSVEDFYRLHDGEQADKLRIVGTLELREKTIADVGCGAGAFLDLVKGFSAATLAIEPARAYHSALRSKGHLPFSYASEAAAEWRGRVDLALCFSVIEHVRDPIELLREIHRLLRPGGRLLVSTPNADDWLLELLPEEYASFFFRVVHRWYFRKRSLEHLARLSGFDEVAVFYVHRYDLSNFLLWLRDRKPTGLGRLAVSPPLDAAFRRTLEADGRADYMYAWLTA